jgi:hypothetical protein
MFVYHILVGFGTNVQIHNSSLPPPVLPVVAKTALRNVVMGLRFQLQIMTPVSVNAKRDGLAMVMDLVLSQLATPQIVVLLTKSLSPCPHQIHPSVVLAPHVQIFYYAVLMVFQSRLMGNVIVSVMKIGLQTQLGLVIFASPPQLVPPSASMSHPPQL